MYIDAAAPPKERSFLLPLLILVLMTGTSVLILSVYTGPKRAKP
jgi:hypothetical protein